MRRFVLGLIQLITFIQLALLPAGAQTLLSIAPQQCVWRAGDDPAWSAPDLNEAAWTPDQNWPLQATSAARYWLRCRFDPASLAPTVQPALQVSGNLAYQVFVDGRMIGASGDVATGAHTVGVVRNYTNPALTERGHPIQVALRMTFTPQLNGEMRIPVLALGDASLQRGNYAAAVDQRVRSQWLTWACYALIGSAGLFFFALYQFDRTQRYLLWISLVWLSLAVLRCNELLAAASVPYSSHLEFFLYWIGQAEAIFFAEFYFALNQRRVPIVYRILQSICLVQVLGLAIASVLPVDLSVRLRATVELNHVAVWLEQSVSILLFTAPLGAFWPWNALRRWRIPLFVTGSLWALMETAYQIVQLPFFADDYVAWFLRLQPLRSVIVAFVVVSMTLLLVERLRSNNRQRASLEGEMQAARHIQQMLAPAQLDQAPGCSVEVVFLPAREVGGDFYLCRVLPGGRQRILLGDVSGKGAAAAMTAAMLIGAAERRDTDSPAALLRHLNLVLCDCKLGGFATCLCADLFPDGCLTLANAGHLPP